MSFMSTIFGGPSSAETSIANSQQGLESTLSADLNQNYGEQSQVFQNLSSQLTPIANAGINQQGYSPQELAALNTQAIDTTGAAARNAQQKTQTQLAGAGGGGSSGLTSGIDAQIAGTEASAASGQLASEQLGITQGNYNTGRQNFLAATGGEQALANAENPTPYGSEATSAGSAAFGEQNTVNTQNGTVLGDIGALGAIGGKALLGGLGNVASGGEEAGTETGGTMEQFMSGMLG